MKPRFSSSPAKSPQKVARSSASSVKGATIIRCGYCENVFSAVPRKAVCLKCKRPANRPLFWPLMLLSVACFPAGLLTSLLLRKSQPYAASQAVLFSVVGAAIWMAIYFVVQSA